MHNAIIFNLCEMNLPYVFTVPGPILRDLDEFGKIRLLLGENLGPKVIALKIINTIKSLFFLV